jgi:hypothetical protein
LQSFYLGSASSRWARSARCRSPRNRAWRRAHARRALDLARQFKARGNEAHALHQLGVVKAQAAPPDAEQAEAYYQQALALAGELGICPLQAHCHHGLDTLHSQTGRAAKYLRRVARRARV